MKALIGLLLLTGALTGQSNDWLVLPGARVGPITARTTRNDLIKLFGAANVVDEEVTVTDVGPDRGSVIFKNRPFDSVTVVWSSDGRISMVVPCLVQWPDPKNCHWHTRDGITFATTLKTIERLNGGAFELVGFAFDHGGTITSWKGGHLASFKVTSCGQVVVRLESHPQTTSQKRVYEQLTGDRPFLSSMPGMQALNPRVDWLALSFADCTGDSRPPAQ